jgi:hypothetical protein
MYAALGEQGWSSVANYAIKGGIFNVQRCFLFDLICSENLRLEAYAKEAEDIFKTLILGDKDRPTQWSLPYDGKRKTLSNLS